jgi:heme-degrading monooxygenase HmoA
MFVRIRHWTTEPGAFDRFVHRLETDGLVAMQGTAGFQRLVVTGDPMSDTVVTVTFWATEAAERVYETDKARSFAKHVEGLVAGKPATFAYPVIADSAA